MGRAQVVGVGMTNFVKPGTSESYDVLGAEAARAAILDADLGYSDIQQAYAGYVYGDSTCGQSALYHVGLTGIPIINVNNNCSTGSSALFLARQAVEAGAVDCALAVGFEQMNPGALAFVYSDRKPVMGVHDQAMRRLQGFEDGAPLAAQYFGGAGLEHMRRYGTSQTAFAMIASKARKHASTNPRAVFRTQLSVEEILAAPRIFGPLTRFQCCPPTCGAAAVVVASEAFAKRRGLKGVTIAAQAMTTDGVAAFDGSMMDVAGYAMAKRAANQVYEAAGIGPSDVDVAELHDCFTANELITYEALGFAAEGEAEKFIMDEDNTYGGAVVTNPSGGLLSKGHPLGATGLAQCAELVWQLRDQAGERQVPRARVALQHNLGLGGACVVTAYMA